MGFINVPNLVPWIIFNVSIFNVTATSLISFAVPIRLHFSNLLFVIQGVNLSREGIKEREMGERGWGAIIRGR